METRKLLFLLRQAPYGTSHALEALEAVLVAGVFEQQVAVLFRDEGVWQLLEGQDGEALATRTLSKVLQALPHYDVDALYVCAESLARRGLSVDDLVLPVQALDAAAQNALVAQQHAVVND